MFGLEAQNKPRKLTTYGKAGRQPSLAFKSFLEHSPEKRKSQASPQDVRDQTSTSLTKQKSDTTWDLPSDDESNQRAQPSKSRAKSTILHKPKLAASGLQRAGGNVPAVSKVKARTVSDEQAAHKKRRRENLATVQNASPAKDVFGFPEDDAVAAPLPLPTRSRAKTPVATTSSSIASTTRPRSRKNTPEPQLAHRTLLTDRKITTELDVYDIPDEDLRMKTKPRAVGQLASPSPTRKRQKTPPREVRTEDKVRAKMRSRATTPQRSHPGRPSAVANPRRKDATSPKSGTSNGILKRKVTKGSSAPASLWTMIREAPSPPVDSSDSAASSGTPEMGSEMEIEPANTPDTPPNRASASLSALAGSVTPRQKLLWAQLLDDEGTDSPSELPLSKLRLTSAVKDSSRKVASLTRSASDVPQSTTSRRKRLIDTLRATALITEADEMDLDEFSLGSESSSKHAPSQASEARPPKLRTEISFKKTSTKVTYGQGRTYLEEKNEDAMWDLLAAEEPGQSYSTFGFQSQGLADDDVDMDGTSQPRAAHDLRAAGSRRRLIDELSSFIMDIEQRTNSQSIRRSALRDLAEKLIQKEAATCFVESGLDSSFLTAVERDTDSVFLFLEAAVVVLIVAADPTPSVLDHVFHSQTFNNIFKLLDLNTSLEKVVRDRKSSLAKMSQAMMLEFRDQLFAADIWVPTKPWILTPRALGLHCVEMVIRKLREHGSSYTLLEECAVKKVLEIARTELSSPTPDMTTIELALSTLQVNTISVPSMRNKIWPRSLTQSFATLLPAILALSDKNGSGNGNENASQPVQLALKLAVELTNHNAAACDTIGTPDVISRLLSSANKRYAMLLDHRAGDNYNVAFDFTVLSFGLTINLTEASDKARLAMLEGGGAALRQAIQLFVRGKQCANDAESLEDTQMNIIYGCLAFTLGNLSRNPVLRRTVAGQFASGNLDVVLDAMQEFAAINRLTDKREFGGEEGHEVSRNFTERLQTVLEEVRALNV